MSKTDETTDLLPAASTQTSEATSAASLADAPRVTLTESAPATAGREERSGRTSPPNSDAERESFRLYKRVGDRCHGPIGAMVKSELRREICERYVPLVTRISRQFRFRRFDATVSEFELQSAGTIGLMKAVDMFDEEVGSSFVAYAAQRIRGEMLDWLREVDPFSRDVRRLERASSRLIKHDGRRPTEHDIAEELDMTPERVRKLQHTRRAMVRQSLDEMITSADDAGGVRRSDLVGDDRAVDPCETIGMAELIERCRNRLTAREEKVFFENALDDRSLKEIGDELGISESRACQIRRSAREKLAEFLVGRGEVPMDWLEQFAD